MTVVQDLSTIKVLYREPDTLSLWGIPYEMRSGVGQEPRHLLHRKDDTGWIWLGTPGWYGSMSKPRIAAVKRFVAKHKEEVPRDPGEWSRLTEPPVDV